MISKVMPIIILLLLFSVVVNYFQAGSIDELKIAYVDMTRERDSAVDTNALLVLQMDEIEQERDENQAILDEVTKHAHEHQQQALAIQAEVKTVILYEKCSHTAIPSAAIERMRKQYQSSDTIQNNRAKTTANSN